MKKKKVLFVTYGGGHVNMAARIHQYLSSKRDYTLCVLALTKSVEVLDAEKIAYREIDSYLDLFPEKERIVALGKELAQAQYDERSGIRREAIEAYLGFSMYDLIAQMGSHALAAEAFEKDGRKIFFPAPTLLRILAQEAPDVVVISCAARMENAAGYAANALGIPVVLINGLPYALPAKFGCTLCVMNEWSKANVQDKYDPRVTEIVVTGQPVFESDMLLDEAACEALKAELHIQKYRKTVLMLTQRIPFYEKAHEKLVEMARAHEEYLFIVKPHPNESSDRYPTYSLENVKIVTRCKLNCLISLCDVAITIMSTAGLQAALMGKPLITIGFGLSYVLDFADIGIAHKASSPEKMEEAIYGICEAPDGEINQRLRKGREMFGNHPHATENIAKIIDHKVLARDGRCQS